MEQGIDETWRPVPGYEGRYEVSDLGRVWSHLSHRLLKGTPWDDYIQVGLWRQRKEATTQIHQLVAAAFLGPRPADKQVRHVNGDGHDNRLTNLAYGTAQENILDEVRHGTHIYSSRSACIRGHEYTPETSFVRTRRGSTERVCRICEGIRESRRDRRTHGSKGRL